jgi:A-kinase anchor protein 13
LQAVICFIVGVLRQKDVEQAQILEEKMALQQKLLAAAGVESMLESPNYSSLVTADIDSSTMWQEVLSAVQVQ